MLFDIGGDSRAYGITNNPNSLGTMSAICLLCGYYLFEIIKNKFIKILNAFIEISCIYTVIISGSRSSIILLIINILMIVFIFKNKHKKELIISLFFIIFIIIVFGYENKIPGINRLINEGIGEDRLSLWSIAIEMFRQKPLIGWGYGVTNLGLQIYNKLIMAFHNSYLSVLVEMGIIGASAFFIYVFNNIIKMLMKLKKIGNRNYNIVILILINYLFVFGAENGINSVGGMEGFSFWLMFYFALEYIRKREGNNKFIINYTESNNNI
jgi:O-antigen ligase